MFEDIFQVVKTRFNGGNREKEQDVVSDTTYLKTSFSSARDAGPLFLRTTTSETTRFVLHAITTDGFLQEKG